MDDDGDNSSISLYFEDNSGAEGGEGAAEGGAESVGMGSEGGVRLDGEETSYDDESDESYRLGSDVDSESSCPSWMIEDLEGPDDDDIFANYSPDHARSVMRQCREEMREKRKKMRVEEQAQEQAELGRDGEVWYSDIEGEGNPLGGENDEWAEGANMGGFELRVGMKFPNRQVFKEVLQDWSIRKGFELKFIKNESRVVTATCKGGCEWKLRASIVQKTTTFQVKTLKGTHTCAYRTENNQADYKYLAKRILETVKDNPNESIHGLKNKIKRDCGIECSLHKVYRAKRHALTLLTVDIAEQFNRLYDYCVTVVKHNPGSSLVVKVNRTLTPPKFQRMYCCLCPIKEGFVAGCRPIIGLDGCFLKGLYSGQLLSAVGRDGNDNMYPIAIAYVEVEKQDSWEWFLKLLLKDIGSAEEMNWTFVSDRQKGLIEVVNELAPNNEHRFCLKHMYNNFKVKFRGLELKKLFWKAASTYNVKAHHRIMKEIERLSPKVRDEVTAYEWLTVVDSKHWARCFFSSLPKCDVIVNNISESFNSFILPARDLPIIDMFEWIRKRCMTRIQVKREGMMNYRENICPNIVKKIEQQRTYSRNCFASWAGDDKYEVMHYLENHIVRLKEGFCSCGFFQLCGYPCCHAMSCIGYHRLEVGEYVHDFFKKDMYMKVYSFSINPVPGMHEFEESTFSPVAPPDVRLRRGRPKKMRRLDGNDQGGLGKASRKGLTYTCGLCKQLGHNKRSCPNKQRVGNEQVAQEQVHLHEQGEGEQEQGQENQCKQGEGEPQNTPSLDLIEQFGWALHEDQPPSHLTQQTTQASTVQNPTQQSRNEAAAAGPPRKRPRKQKKPTQRSRRG